MGGFFLPTPDSRAWQGLRTVVGSSLNFAQIEATVEAEMWAAGVENK